MKIATAVTIIASAFAVGWTRHRLELWNQSVQELEKQLVEGSPLRYADSDSGAWKDLPPVVQDYLTAAFTEEADHDVRSVRFSQSGDFRSSPESSWTSFSAEQLISSNPPGFVWDASIALTSFFATWPYIQVCDALTQEGGVMKAALLNVWDIPLVNDEDEETKRQMKVGEAMRWLVESVFVPSALHPDAGLVSWKAIPDRSNQALVTLMDPELPEVKLTVTFDPQTGWPGAVTGQRPKWDESTSTWTYQTWQAFMDTYEIHGGIWVPTKAKVGWVNPQTGNLELYFRGSIFDFQFTWNRFETVGTAETK